MGSMSQAMHPAIAGHLHRRINQTRMGEEELNKEPSPFGEQEEIAGRFPRRMLRDNPQKFTDRPKEEYQRGRSVYEPMVQLATGMDTRDYGHGPKATILGDKKPGVSVSNRGDGSPDALLNVLQIHRHLLNNPSPKNLPRFDFNPYEPQEYAQMSPRDSEGFEEIFNRFMERRRMGNPDNVQMLPGNIMQQM